MLLQSCSINRISKLFDLRWSSIIRTSSKLHQPSNNFRFYSSLPPHTLLKLPALSPTMQTGTIVKWELNEGDGFEVGDLLAEIETDKATLGFEATDDGFLARILVAEGTKNIEVGTTVAVTVEDASLVSQFKNYTTEQSTNQQPASQQPANQQPSSQQPANQQPASQQPANQQPASQPSVSNFPKHTTVDLPALSPTMTSGSLISWELAVGDKIEEGDALAMIETDKASVALEIQEEGYLAKILVDEGAKDLDLGTPLCVIVENLEDVKAFKDFNPKNVAQQPPAQQPPAQQPPAQQPSAQQSPAQQPPVQQPPAQQPPVQQPPVPTTNRIFASPYAKKLASERNLNLADFAGSGPQGRVRSSDLNQKIKKVEKVEVKKEEVKKEVVASGDYQDIPVSNIRKVIAERLSESKQTIPHYYLSVDIEMDEVLKTRKMFNEKLPEGQTKISVNDFIIKASALSCLKVPETNSSWKGTFIRKFASVDVNVAVSTDRGLITPIVYGAHTKGLFQIADDVKDLATRARSNQLKPEEFMGGTFTISNLGMFGVNNFSAVINPPQSSILAVGNAKKILLPTDDHK